MDQKLNVLKEAGKLAAYVFVTVGLAGTTIAQSKVVREALSAATKKA
jgi:hypothetical protein